MPLIGIAVIRHVQHNRLDTDLDAVRRRAVLDPLVPPQRAEQAGFPHFPLTNQNQLRLIENDLIFGLRS